MGLQLIPLQGHRSVWRIALLATLAPVAAWFLSRAAVPTRLHPDYEAEEIQVRAQERGVGFPAITVQEMFQELGVDPACVSEHRFSFMGRGSWHTWRISPSFDLTLYGDLRWPEGVFKAEVQARRRNR